ncbi:MAG: AbrB family transcriptional regulator [Oscillatoria sp. SIO1A7]|nr:AbrB family transcriptional regulator [Oscillatoria sp. SIO1A7]
MSEDKEKTTNALTGQALLGKVKELRNLPKEEKAKACGYSAVTKNGERVNMMAFLNALIDAKGIKLDPPGSGEGRKGRGPSYRVGVQSNGNLLIGAVYTQQMKLKPGDKLEVNIGRKNINLKQVGQE